MGISMMAIDPETFHVYIDPVMSESLPEYSVEGTDNFFYTYGYCSPKRLSLGITQGKGRRIKNTTLEQMKEKMNNLRKQVMPGIWSRFMKSLDPLQRKTVNEMLKGKCAVRTNKLSPHTLSIISFLKTKKIRELYRENDLVALTDFNTLFVLLSSRNIQFYSWPGYYDTEAPMKFLKRITITSEVISDVIEFMKDTDYESRRDIFPSVPSFKTKANKQKRMDLIRSAVNNRKKIFRKEYLQKKANNVAN